MMSLTLEDLERDLLVMNMRKVEGIEKVHQLTGAIAILEQQIQKVKNPESVEPPATPPEPPKEGCDEEE